MMASSPSFGFTDDWKRRKVLVLSTRSHIGGLNIMMLKGPRTLPRPPPTASKIGRCSGATLSLVVMGITRGMVAPFRRLGAAAPDSLTEFYRTTTGLLMKPSLYEAIPPFL